MLATVNGHIDDNRVIVNENISDWEGRNVIVTILDSSWHQPPAEPTADDSSKRAAAIGLAGLWRDHDNDLPVEKIVRDMRKGRLFDT